MSLGTEIVIPNAERQQILADYLDVVLNDYFMKEREVYKKSMQKTNKKLDQMLKAREQRAKISQA